jgi:uncharacterized protein YjbI with pentapeptide repeats
MANEEHIKILLSGIEEWNRWREQNPGIQPDLSGKRLAAFELQGANLRGANLSEIMLPWGCLNGMDLRCANLSYANLVGIDLSSADLSEAFMQESKLSAANLEGANLSGANLRGAILSEADLRDAKLTDAKLADAKLIQTNLFGADMRGADLRGAVLESAVLHEANLEGANLSGCYVHGVTAWDARLGQAKLRDLVITPLWGRCHISVDGLQMAQFIDLFLHAESIRGVVETVSSRVVLILGHFDREQVAALDALRDALRMSQPAYLPAFVDFATPANRFTLEAVSVLARIARFIIVDITDWKTDCEELSTIVRSHALPVQPLLLEGSAESAPRFFASLQGHNVLLPACFYQGLAEDAEALRQKVIAPAEALAKTLFEKGGELIG